MTNGPTGHSQRVLTPSGRLVCLALCGLLLFAAGLARRLDPDPRGFGTHQQLGLPECLFRQLFGVSCPQCGMTTSMTCLVRGQIGGAMRANPMGIVLGLLCAMAFGLLMWSGLSGRLATGLECRWLMRIGCVYVMVCVLLWITRIPML